MNGDEVRELTSRLKRWAESEGFFLNPDAEMVRSLVEGLLINRERYGYMSCPCIEAEGLREKDRDIICPCYYREADIEEFGTCYCSLYVSAAAARGELKIGPIPLRRLTTTPAEARGACRRGAADKQ